MASYENYPIPRSALLFMAAVEEARKTQEGPFRAISPIFRLALEPQRGQVLNISHAISILSPVLGENFTDHVLESFLPQLCSLGWLVEERAQGSASAYRVPQNIPEFDEREAAEASEQKLARLYTSFQSFLESYAPLLKRNLTKEEFQWLLFKWATSLDGSDKDAIKSEAVRLNSGGKSSIKNNFLDETQRFSRIDKSASVEFAGFVKWLSKHKKPELIDIASLTELGLAIEFIDEIRRSSSSDKRISGAIFVLDAPVLLDMFGLSGPSRKVSIERCIKVIASNGGRVATLSHCLEELSEILKTVLDRPAYRRFGLTGDALRADPELISRANEVCKQPDRAAKIAGVEVLFFDPKSPVSVNCFPDELIDRFRNTATWHDYYKTDQRQRDAYSIAFVMRRRNGKSNSDVMENNFTFVTRNSTFTNFSDVFVKKNLNVPKFAFGPAIETKTLAALVWLRYGSVENADLPQMHLISACDRILATNGELLRRAEKRIKELKSDEAATALLSSQQAVLDLVIAAGGSPDVIDGADGAELLRAFSASAEERGRLDEREKAAERESDLREKIAEENSRSQELEAKAKGISLEKIAVEAKLKESQLEIDRINKSDEQRIDSAANAILESSKKNQWIIVSAIWASCAFLGLMGQFLVWQGPDWWLKSNENMAIGILVILLSSFALSFGLRFLPPGRVDFASSFHSYLVRRSISRRLTKIHPSEDRDRIKISIERLMEKT